MTWITTDYDARRTTRRIAWLPVFTFDAGWIWLRRYWLHERHYGWGFVDKHAYRWRKA